MQKNNNEEMQLETQLVNLSLQKPTSFTSNKNNNDNDNNEMSLLQSQTEFTQEETQNNEKENMLFQQIAIQLVNHGLGNEKLNKSLLKRTNCNIAVVTKFLEAKKELEEQTSLHRQAKLKLRFQRKTQREERQKNKMMNSPAKLKHRCGPQWSTISETSENQANTNTIQPSEKAPNKFRQMYGKKNQNNNNNTSSDNNNNKEKRNSKKNQNNSPDSESKTAENETWDEQCTHLYIDANNQLFCSGVTRQLMLQKKRRDQAELLLVENARQFAVAHKLAYTLVIFDAMKSQPFEISHDFGKVVVSKATPNFKTSDDALVHLAPKSAAHSVFVTADVELKQRLLKAAPHPINLMGPKKFLVLAANEISHTDVDSHLQALFGGLASQNDTAPTSTPFIPEQE